MKDRLFTFALAVAALVAVIFLLSPSERQSAISIPSTEDSGRDGLKGLLAWLQREQVPSRAGPALRFYVQELFGVGG